MPKSHPLFDLYDQILARQFPPPELANAPSNAAGSSAQDAAPAADTAEQMDQLAEQVKMEAQQEAVDHALLVGTVLDAVQAGRRKGR